MLSIATRGDSNKDHSAVFPKIYRPHTTLASREHVACVTIVERIQCSGDRIIGHRYDATLLLSYIRMILRYTDGCDSYRVVLGANACFAAGAPTASFQPTHTSVCASSDTSSSMAPQFHHKHKKKQATSMLFRCAAALLLFVSPVVGFSASSAAIKPNTDLPSAQLHSGFPPEFIDIAEYAADKNLIIVGLPGAVRKGCLLL